jgi:hypothetical protein
MLILNPMNEYRSAFPILEVIHIAGIVCGVGTAVLVNLRLLGVGLTQKTGRQLWKNVMPLTLGGLALAIFAGLLLFSIDPEMYYVNLAFRFKMLFLVLAIAFYFTMVRKAVVADSRGSRIVACISLGLWTLVPFGGVFIGFVGSTAYTYPVLLSVHVVALVLLGGMVVLTDLRWLGLGMRGFSVRDVTDGLRVPKRIALGLAAASGVVLFSAHAEQYARNPWFWVKIALLAVIAANYLLFRRTSSGKLSSGLSLLLWASVVIAARGPATVKDIMHSMIDPSGDFLFHSVQTIADDSGVREIAPHTDAEWENVRQRLIILQEAPDLLEGRRAARIRDRSKNPEVESQPEEIQTLLDSERATFVLRAQRLRDAAAVAMKAVDAKNKDALLVGLDGIDKACESCHLRYWYPKDKRAHEAAKQDGVVE